MDLLQAVVLALLQGLTEFLPISSSAHLILLPRLFGWPDQGLAFDVAVHVGTLMAVLLYFKVDIRELSLAWCRRVSGGEPTQQSRLAWAVIIGTVPVALVGYVINGGEVAKLRDPLLIATTTLIFGIFLWWSDRRGRHSRNEYTLTIPQALLIGCAQAIALIPGTSRSGVAMTAALILGLTRKAAARFSFLLSIPVILLAGITKFVESMQQSSDTSWMMIGVGTVVSGITAYLCIHFFLTLVERIGLLPFVIYRILLALFLFYLFI